jgi:ABC-type ATPase with predicted acetyltransferase domain
MNDGVAIRVDHVSKMFRLYHEKNQYLKSALLSGKRARYDDFWAVKDVSFEVNTGSTFGIIGSNGSGKSTLLKCIAGILTPEQGSIETHGRTAALLELGSGFHPDLSGRENVFLNGALLGLSRGELEKKFDEDSQLQSMLIPKSLLLMKFLLLGMHHFNKSAIKRLRHFEGLERPFSSLVTVLAMSLLSVARFFGWTKATHVRLVDQLI